MSSRRYVSWSCGGPGDPSHTNQQPWSVLCDFSKPAILASFHFCLFLLFFFFVPFSLFLSGFPLYFYFPFILFVPFFPLIFCQIFFFFFFFAAFLVGFSFTVEHRAGKLLTNADSLSRSKHLLAAQAYNGSLSRGFRISRAR